MTFLLVLSLLAASDQLEIAEDQADLALRQFSLDRDPANARAMLDAALRGCGTNKACQARITQAKAELQDFRKATQSLAKETWSRARSLSESVKKEAELKRKAGDFDGAAVMLEDYLALQSRFGGSEVSRHAVEADVRVDLADVHWQDGDLETATGHYESAADLYARIGNTNMQSAALARSAEGYAKQKEHTKANVQLEEALELVPQDSVGAANVLKVRGNLFAAQGDHPQAIADFQRALGTYEAANRPTEEADVLVRLGTSQGLHQDRHNARVSLDRAVELYDQTNDLEGQAKALAAEGSLLLRTGDGDEAYPTLAEAATCARALKSDALEGSALALLAEARPPDGAPVSPAAATFLRKLSARAFADEGSDPRADDLIAQDVGSVVPSETFQKVAEQLFTQGRFAEAFEVAALRETRDAQALLGEKMEGPDAVPFSAAEAAVAREFNTRLERVASLRRELMRTRRMVNPRNLKGALASVSLIESRLSREQSGFETFLASIPSRFPNDASAGIAALADAKYFKLVKQALIGTTDTVAIKTITTDKELLLVLVTPTSEAGFRSNVTAAQLDEQILALRGALRTPSVSFSRNVAAALYESVFPRDLVSALGQAGATTILWDADKNLRQVPLAALWDRQSQKYLVEQYRTVTINPASSFHLMRAVRPTWSIVAFGGSQGGRGLKPLPGVKRELEAVVREGTETRGLLAGRRYMDSSFRLRELEAALLGNVPVVVHIASHFVFDYNADNRVQSFLLLGDGDALQLSELARLRFDNVDLLVLSACDTALAAAGTTASALAGAETDGLAVTAHGNGAAAVLATLWRISDAATPSLLSDFYRRRMLGVGTNKAQALQEAQLAMLRGELNPVKTWLGDLGRGFEDGGTLDPGVTDWSHPAYWASFVLMGNWK